MLSTVTPMRRPRKGRPVLGDETRFLSGPLSRLSEFLNVVSMAIEFIKGFRVFHFHAPAVTVFGSARIAPGSPTYQQAEAIGAALARAGYTVVTGGGPGVMEAASKGAQEAGGYTIGANILGIRTEQTPNPYLDRVVNFNHFFVRKVMLIKYSLAYVILPGGFGTLDELTEALTLMQTGKLPRFPVILVDRKFWADFVSWTHDTLGRLELIDAQDLKELKITDDPAEVIQWVGIADRRKPLKSS